MAEPAPDEHAEEARPVFEEELLPMPDWDMNSSNATCSGPRCPFERHGLKHIVSEINFTSVGVEGVGAEEAVAKRGVLEQLECRAVGSELDAPFAPEPCRVDAFGSAAESAPRCTGLDLLRIREPSNVDPLIKYLRVQQQPECRCGRRLHGRFRVLTQTYFNNSRTEAHLLFQ